MRDIELRWMVAIDEFRERKLQRLETELGELRIPLFAREFLVDVARGMVQPRHKGRPPKWTEGTKRKLVCEVYAEWDRLKKPKARSPLETAIATIAERHKISDDTLRRIMEELRRQQGFTPEVWRTYLKLNPK